MGIRSDVAMIISFDDTDKNILEFKSLMNEIILKNIEDENFVYLISNFYRTIESSEIEFLFYEESIKSEYIPITKFIEYLDESKFIKYEYKELCTEYLEAPSTTISNKDGEDESRLFIKTTIDGIPEIVEISLLDYLKK